MEYCQKQLLLKMICISLRLSFGNYRFIHHSFLCVHIYLCLKRSLHLRFSTRTGNSISSKLFCDRSRRWLHVYSQVSPIFVTCCKSSVRSIFWNIIQAILLQNPPLATRGTCWFHNPYNIRKKSCVASASKNVPRVVAA